MAAELDRLNKERQAIEAAVLDTALERAETADRQADPLLLIADEDWHAGVIGIVASRLKDRYHKPTFILSIDGEEAKGSGRSVPGVDLGAAVTAAKQAGLLSAGGGHAMAAGLTVARDKIDALRDFLNDRIGRQLAETPVVNSLGIDGVLQVRAANRDLYDTLEGAGPYGAGHPEPRFVVPAAEIVKASVVGLNHVSLLLAKEGKGRLKAIAFRSVDQPLGQALLHHAGKPIHIAGHLRADDWQGRRNVQVIVDDAAFPTPGEPSI